MDKSSVKRPSDIDESSLGKMDKDAAAYGRKDIPFYDEGRDSF